MFFRFKNGPQWQALFWRFERFDRLRSYVRPHMMMWTASPQRHHSAKAWSPERHKEGDRP